MADARRLGYALVLCLAAAAIAAACSNTSGGTSLGDAGGIDASAGAGGSSADGGLEAAGGVDGSDAWSWGGGGNSGGSIGYVCDAGGFWPCTYNPDCTAVKTAPADHDAYRTTDCRTCHGPAIDGGAPEAGTDASFADAGTDASAADAGTDASATDASAADAGTDASATDAGVSDSGADSGTAPQFLFSGFVWDPYTPKGEPKIEIGVRDGNVFYYACTDANGFFFIPRSAGPEPDWSKAENHARSAIGEKIMPSDKPHGAGCNSAPGCHGDPQHHLLAPL